MTFGVKSCDPSSTTITSTLAGDASVARERARRLRCS
jgi:hypothetical protein